MKTSLPMTALACVLLSTSALAALTLQRTTHLNDSLGGSLNISTTGTLEIPGADTTSQATLTNFHPHDNQDLVANGSVTRTHTRSAEVATNTFSGNLSLTGTDNKGNAVNDTLVLQNLQVVREGKEGPAFTGTIVRNGTIIDAAHMPEDTKHLLHRVLRFFYLD